jgi:hypothetical protein
MTWMVGTSPTMTDEGDSPASSALIQNKKKAPAEAGA